MNVLARRLLAVHASLDAARVPHAFGGAIALAYCTGEPRGTRDIDVNVFVGPDRAEDVLSALPGGVAVPADGANTVRDVGQVRLWWADTPIDLFFDVHEFHVEVESQVREVPLSGTVIPVLGCTALAVFKVVFNRTKDWADIEAMFEMEAVDSVELLGWVTRLFGSADSRLGRLQKLLST